MATISEESSSPDRAAHARKALLTLAASTDIPYRGLAVMTVGRLDTIDGTAGITDISGETRITVNSG